MTQEDYAMFRNLYISLEEINDIKACIDGTQMTQEEYDILFSDSPLRKTHQEYDSTVLKKTFRSIDEDWQVSKEQKNGA